MEIKLLNCKIIQMKKIWGTTLFLGETDLDTIFGRYHVKVFQNIITKRYILALIYHSTNLKAEKLQLYTRIHSSCVTSEMLNSQDCDCVEQLNGALKVISEKGSGILFYLIQEGRGCGYIGKARACQMVQHSECTHTHGEHILTTFDAYNNLGMKPDYRRYGNIKEILQMLNIYKKSSFILLSNNPDKIKAFNDHGIQLLGTERIEYVPNSYNKSYLISKSKFGHKLSKLDGNTHEYNIPYEAIKPFEPYHLENIKRFIYCAAYFIPIKIVDNHLLLNDEYAKKLNINILAKNNIYKLSDYEINNFELKPAYWFKVNLFYDISSNLDYVVLEYKNPFNQCNNIPIVRFHSESLFDRFPLQETLYQDRYKKAILEIVKNGIGYLILFYRDGRGAGLGYYLLNIDKLNSKKIGITKDLRDYDAAIQLIKFFVKKSNINVLYTNYSIDSLKKHLRSNNLVVNKYINIDNCDNSGKKSIISRVLNLNNELKKCKVINKINIDKNKNYIITGLGSSKYHAKYFIYLLKKYYDIDSKFIPIIAFKDIANKGEDLIVISQGLSYNSHIALKKWEYKNIILITGEKIKFSDDNKKKIIMNELIKHNSQIYYFLDDSMDNTLVRITGPFFCYYHIYNLLIPKDKYCQYKFDTDHLIKIPNKIMNLFINNYKKIKIYILCDYPEIEFVGDLGNRLMEVLFCSNPIIIDYLEFVHGTYQTSIIDNNSIYICFKSKFFKKFKSLFINNDSNILYLESSNNLDLSILDYEIIINDWIKQIVEISNLNFQNWEGKNIQSNIYNITE